MLPEPTSADVQHLAGVIAEAKLRGIEHGAATLARVILAAGWRRTPDPAPSWTAVGRCRCCPEVVPLDDQGRAVEHRNSADRPCLGVDLTPLEVR